MSGVHTLQILQRRLKYKVSFYIMVYYLDPYSFLYNL